jgi:hypothetical protein
MTKSERPAYRIETLNADGEITKSRWIKPSDNDEIDIMRRIGNAYRMRNTRVIRVERNSETVIHDRTD